MHKMSSTRVSLAASIVAMFHGTSSIHVCFPHLNAKEGGQMSTNMECLIFFWHYTVFVIRNKMGFPVQLYSLSPKIKN
jgi:hypothetical protein